MDINFAALKIAFLSHLNSLKNFHFSFLNMEF